MQKSWYISRGNQVSGPFEQGVILQFSADGVLSPDTLICAQGTQTWLPLREVPEFSRLQRVSGRWDQENVRYIFYCPQCGQKYSAEPDEMLSAGGKRAAVCERCGACFVADVVPFSPAGESAHSTGETRDFLPGEHTRYLPPEMIDGEIQCPHCWGRFSASDILYISAHTSLTGDPVLGQFAQQRFSPTIYTPQGIPLDAKEMPCTDMACPHCHLPIPSSVVDMPATFISIVGAPSAGKSYYLTSLIHQLRAALPRFCSASFADADPTINQVVNHYETQLFFSADAAGVTALKKTDTFGPDFSDQVILHNLEIQLPKPFIFLSQSMAGENRLNRNFIFYDNAGELFQPGMDTTENPGTRHLAASDAIFFLFDPLNDSGMREICNADDPQLATTEKLTNQTTFFAEMVSRIKRHCNISQNQKAPASLIVLVGKCDNWADSFEFDLRTLSPCRLQEATLTPFLDLNCIDSVSFALRQLLLRYSPGLVAQAEAFFQDVTFLPCSSFGRIAVRQEASGKESAIGIAPRDIHPIWVEIPFFLLLARLGFFPGIAEKVPAQELRVRAKGEGILFQHPVSGEPVTLPAVYAGRNLQIGGKYYRIPGTASFRPSAEKAETPVW